MSFQASFSKIVGILRAEIQTKARKCSIFAIKVHKCDICCIEHAQNHEKSQKYGRYMGSFAQCPYIWIGHARIYMGMPLFIWATSRH